MMQKRKQLVLVVDDHPKVLRFIEIDLKLRGFEVITTTSGKKALDLIRSEKPDIMLLDIIMPEMDGYKVLGELHIFAHLPVIAFSACSDNRERALRSGADDFMTKPFHLEEMARKIDALLNHHEKL